jgi:hypothetical protein
MKMSDRIETFIAFGDNHGDIVDPFVEAALVRHIRKGFMGRPFTHRIHLGDCFDARAWRRGASQSERQDTTAKDREAGKAFLKATRPSIFLFGNHDDRILQWAEGSGPEADLALIWKNELMETLRKVGCKEVLPYNRKHGKWRLGPITFIHGFRSGKQAVREEARTYCTPGGCLIMGHLHRIHRENIEKDGGAVGISAGCIGDIDKMDYAKTTGAILTWGQGWVYGYLNRTTGVWRVFEAFKEGREIKVVGSYSAI